MDIAELSVILQNKYLTLCIFSLNISDSFRPHCVRIDKTVIILQHLLPTYIKHKTYSNKMRLNFHIMHRNSKHIQTLGFEVLYSLHKFKSTYIQSGFEFSF